MYRLVLEDSYVANVGNKGVCLSHYSSTPEARGIPDLDELRNASRNADPLFPAFARLARAPSLAATDIK